MFWKKHTVNQTGVRKSQSIKGTKRKKSFNEEKVLIVKPEPFLVMIPCPAHSLLPIPFPFTPLLRYETIFSYSLLRVIIISEAGASSFEKVSMKPQGFDIIGCLLFITILLNKLPIVWCQ